MGFISAHTTKELIPPLPFENIAEHILGKKYQLSVTFVSPQKMRALNRRARGIDRSTDILSFALSDDMGELYISLPNAKKKAPTFGMTERDYLGFLFIHGCLHLEGHDHGRTMEQLERKFCRAFRFPCP
ncbi:MAG: rRNA maturation RNase YbeY [Patescibacteria group bacterium]|nr:rRNA maturation RNase YbeY [Patescibacteria group bacterium]